MTIPQSVQLLGLSIPVPEAFDAIYETETIHVDPLTVRQICLAFESMKKDAARQYPVKPGWVELDFELWVVRYRITIK